MEPIAELGRLLRPAGGGLYLVSTGRAEQVALQRRLYSAASEEEVQERFHRALAAIPTARAVILGIPSDVGAGYLRGANIGPQAIRTALLDEDPAWSEHAAARGIVDLGDVFVVPQLLHDDMLSPGQRASACRALYPDLPDADLPVSPLSIAERALDLVLTLNPRVAPLLLGGDHSTAWPAAAALARHRREPWGIVQSDAHTDLLPERLGVKYCFATWSYHANDLLGRGGRLVQVGIRASRHDRDHWERTLDVRQFWAEQCLRRPGEVLDAIVAHLRQIGVRGVYFSNDIDGTDSSYADATGTPEPNGLEPEFVLELIARLGRDIGLLGGDVMEVAPPIARTPDGAVRTVALAARYLRATLDGILAPG
ncbi:MAG: arginase family protein [Myxococcales bacterium]|nr:arginase family protein [Myxococcales bacterium]